MNVVHFIVAESSIWREDIRYSISLLAAIHGVFFAIAFITFYAYYALHNAAYPLSSRIGGILHVVGGAGVSACIARAYVRGLWHPSVIDVEIPLLPYET